MKKFARFPLRGRPLFVYLGGSCQNVQVGLGWAIVGGWLGGWLGAILFCQVVLVSLMAVSPRQCVWVCFSLLVLVLGCACVSMTYVFAVCLIVLWCFSN